VWFWKLWSVLWKNRRGRKKSMRFWKNSERMAWVWGTLVGFLFLGIGVVRNDLAVIWQKAVMICMECIGLG
ncbi:MAG: hypothetical protein K2N00_09665, partial [Lachnospiraceae bacterium]|nr:hypothetical protein [Lachnospiraceae bacterium]